MAIGFGINVRLPHGVPAAALRAGAQRIDVLASLVPALRQAAAETGTLRDEELDAYAGRDYARGRRCREPVVGAVTGINSTGALVVESENGVQIVRSGSLVLLEEA